MRPTVFFFLRNTRRIGHSQKSVMQQPLVRDDLSFQSSVRKSVGLPTIPHQAAVKKCDRRVRSTQSSPQDLHVTANRGQPRGDDMPGVNKSERFSRTTKHTHHHIDEYGRCHDPDKGQKLDGCNSARQLLVRRSRGAVLIQSVRCS